MHKMSNQLTSKNYVLTSSAQVVRPTLEGFVLLEM